MISPAEISTGDPHRPLVLTACHATLRTDKGIEMHKSLDVARIKHLKSIPYLCFGAIATSRDRKLNCGVVLLDYTSKLLLHTVARLTATNLFTCTSA